MIVAAMAVGRENAMGGGPVECGEGHGVVGIFGSFDAK